MRGAAENHKRSRRASGTQVIWLAVKETKQQGCAERVMVIDDDALMRELLSVLLGAEGCEVLTADSGDTALAMLEEMQPQQMPEVLLTDLKMPGVSHAALALALRVTCPPPAVLVAMSASEPDAEVAAYDAFLRKPFDMEEYQQAVERARQAVLGKRSSPRSEQPASLPGDSKEERASAPEETGAAQRVLNEDIYDRMAAVMGAEELPPLYAMFMEDAATRGERMAAAVAVSDEVTFRREAHAIKGGCGMLGATELFSLARRMETGGLSCSPLLEDLRPALERLRRMLEKRTNTKLANETKDMRQ